jgi:HD-like signal output (HDOD) protein
MAPSIEAERLIFGTDHARLGALAADRWNLPGEIGAVIGNYHTPSAIASADLRKLAHTLALTATTAEAACSVTKAPASDEPPEVLTTFANAVGVTTSEAICLIDSVQSRIPTFLEELVQE